MQCTDGDKGDRGIRYVEPNVAQYMGPGEPQSWKPCEKCLYFNRSLVSNPCHDCYVSKDKHDWTEKDEGNDRPDEMEPSDFRVCEACS